MSGLALLGVLWEGVVKVVGKHHTHHPCAIGTGGSMKEDDCSLAGG